MAEASIGIFDSGVGGLTVLRRIIDRFPHESTIYLGDTARVPYGTKSPETVIRYAEACAKTLCREGIKLLVVACNTASAFALDALTATLEMPVLGVIEPGARAAVAATRSGRIGVIGTAGTIRSGRYQSVIERLAPHVTVFSKPCPLFVPLAEEGWTEGPLPSEAARTYLAELNQHDIDTLVLGCTHYPLLTKVIGEAVQEHVVLVDSADATSGVVGSVLAGAGALSPSLRPPARRFLVTDDPAGFARTGRRFLGSAIDVVEWVDLP